MRELSTARAMPSHCSLSDKLHVVLIASYVSISGIYWLPGVPSTILPQLKITVFGLLCFIGLLRIPRAIQSQGIIVIMRLGICAIAAFIANTITGGAGAGFNQMRDFLEPLLWLIALFGVRPQAYQWLFKSLTVTMTVFTIASFYPVAAYSGILPNLYPPIELVDPTGLRSAVDKQWVLQLGSVVGGGFAGQSTTWGALVPPAALLTAALYLRGQLRPRTARIIAGIVIVGSIASIAVTSARGGTMTLAAMAIYGVAVSRGIHFSSKAMFFIIILLVLSLNVTEWLPDNFFRGFDSKGDVLTRVNEASTGRIDSWVFGLKRFASSPIYGVGVEGLGIESVYGIGNVHNTWINILAESGLIVFLPMIFLAARLFSLALNNGKRPKTIAGFPAFSWPDTRLVILSGLILSMAEPGIIFGNFNSNAPFWTAVWIALVRSSYLRRVTTGFRSSHHSVVNYKRNSGK